MQDRRDFIRLGALGLAGLFATEVDGEILPRPNKVAKPVRFKSWKKLQSCFDINKDIAYFNTGTMGLSPKPVMDAVSNRMEFVNQTGSYSGHKKELKKALALFTGAKPNEVALTHNVSEGINIAAWSLPLKAGDEVILTDHEHVGNALPWLNRQRLENIRIRPVELQPTAEATLDAIKALTNEKTRVIAVPHVTCTTGQVLPIKQIVEFAQSRDIRTFIDGAHGLGMLNLELNKTLGCDVYASCGHKWNLGPKGTGFLYAREDLIQELTPHFVGGYSDTGWKLSDNDSKLEGYVDNAHRFHYGTQNSALYAGWNAAVSFFDQVGKDKIYQRIGDLNDMVLEGLQNMNGISILTPTEKMSRGGLISFVFDNQDTRALYSKLRENKWVIRFVGESDLNCIRISTHIYNSESQIEGLLSAIRSCV